MTWWCSASGNAWSWTWRAYPGIWLFVGLLAAGYFAWRRKAGGPVPGRSLLWGVLGLLAVWGALDWPLGLLGAGYLASAHAVSYLLLSFIAPPLLIAGLPPGAIERALAERPWGILLRLAARPSIALAGYSAALLISHIPDVVDSALSSQFGSMIIDLAWLGTGLLLWWPVMAPAQVSRLSRPLKMLYLFLSTLPSIIPSAFLTFSDYPLYSVYELAPRVFALNAHDDQQLAGLTMKILGDVPIWIAFAVVFFRWAGEEQRRAPPPPHPGATPPRPSSRTLPAS
jgi:putative membrane protein